MNQLIIDIWALILAWFQTWAPGWLATLLGTV
jgi:hypothetical protein